MTLRFQILEKWENWRLHLNVQKPKVHQLHRAWPVTSDRSSAPGPCWGLYPQIPVIGSLYRPCYGAVPQILRARTATACRLY